MLGKERAALDRIVSNLERVGTGLGDMAELLELASMQEKIFLNSNNYAVSVSTAYNGTSAGGLGRTTAKSAPVIVPQN